jgi:hypothetical protein
MGNLHLKKGEKGPALTFWEKALVLDPANEILKNNIRIAKENPIQ